MASRYPQQHLRLQVSQACLVQERHRFEEIHFHCTRLAHGKLTIRKCVWYQCAKCFESIHIEHTSQSAPIPYFQGARSLKTKNSNEKNRGTVRNLCCPGLMDQVGRPLLWNLLCRNSQGFKIRSLGGSEGKPSTIASISRLISSWNWKKQTKHIYEIVCNQKHGQCQQTTFFLPDFA